MASDSAKHFRSSINRIRLFNGLTDLYVFSEERHFDNEKILGGRQRIKLGLDAVKANIKQDNFDAARRSLGQTLHTLQVYYTSIYELIFFMLIYVYAVSIGYMFIQCTR